MPLIFFYLKKDNVSPLYGLILSLSLYIYIYIYILDENREICVRVCSRMHGLVHGSIPGKTSNVFLERFLKWNIFPVIHATIEPNTAQLASSSVSMTYK